MPTYDYLCTDCGNKFEEFQKMTDQPLTECPTCGGNVKRLIGAGIGPIFKGSGFYQTDYKNSSPQKENNKNISAADKKTETSTNTSKESTDTKKPQ